MKIMLNTMEFFYIILNSNNGKNINLNIILGIILALSKRNKKILENLL
jgi:hypothetical protein